MYRISTFLIFILSFVIGCSAVNESTPQKSEILKDFSLLNTNNEIFRFYETKDKKAIVLFSYGVGCPIARLLTGEMNRLEKKYKAVDFKYIYSNYASAEINKKEVLEEKKNFEISSDVLLDNSMMVAKSLGIKRTCEALLIDPTNFSVVYRGMVSERFNYGIQKKSGRDYLEEALEAFLGGRSPKIRQTQAKGCSLYFPKVSINFKKNILPIFKNHCLKCHNDLGRAPFSFKDMNSLAKWSSMSQEVVLNKRMPPREVFF